MKLRLLIILTVFLVYGNVSAQVSLTNAAPTVTIDFSNTMQTTVGTNPSTAFTGAGFAPNPASPGMAGRLNSSAWETTGWENGPLLFGGTMVNPAHARGSVTGGVITEGIYAYTELPASVANPTMMIQPADDDFSPGSVVLKIKNNGTMNMTQLAVSYNIFVRNDENRASSFNFSHSLDNVVFEDEPTINYTSPETADALQWVSVDVTPSRAITITGINVAPGGFYYIRWTCDDVSGSGARDEFGLDDITLTAMYGAPAAEINVIGVSGQTILSGDTTPAVADGTYFSPATSTLLATKITTYKIQNLGGANLNVSNIAITGANASDFTISDLPTALGTIAPLTNKDLTVIFDPSAPGMRTAIITITNTDSNEGSYFFHIQGEGYIPQPDITVKGLTGGVGIISSGNMIPVTTNNTLWGTQMVGTGVTKDFRIRNDGQTGAVLQLTGTPVVSIGGLNPTDFVVTTAPSSTSITPGFGTNFIITFTPTAQGIRSAIVSIANNDIVADPFTTLTENPYTFLIQGTGVSPEIDVKGNSQPIVNGSTTPTLVNHTFFDYLNILTGTLDRTYTIQNTGTMPLTLGTVTITGPQAGDFSIITPPVTPVAAAGSTTLTIRFNPTAVGVRNATVSIPSNDFDENPYTFAISGYGLNYTPCNYGALETIAIQDFETAPATPVWPYSLTGTATATNGTAFGLNGDGGMSDTFLGARSLQVKNATATVTMGAINTTSYSDIELNLRLASLGAIGTDGNDVADKVTIAVSTNGGSSWSGEIEVQGNTEAKWTFASGTGIASTVYDGNNIAAVFAPATGGYLTTNGYSIVSISGLPKVASLVVRVTINNNTANEIWAIDNVSLFGRKEISTTWDGSAWSNGVPVSTIKAIFNGNYNTTLGNISACKCEIMAGRNIVIEEDDYFNIESDLDNKGSININNGGSLVQRNDFATNSGNVAVKRYTTPMKRYDYTYWSSPVAGQSLFNLSPLTLSDKYFQYNTTAGVWQNMPGATIMQPAKGYIIRAPQTFSTTVAAPYTAGEFIGLTNNGFIQTPVVKAGTSDWNLLGNPYPSAMDADVFLGFPANTGIVGGTIYFWTHNTPITNNVYTDSDYAAYNLVGGVGTAAPNSGVNPTVPTGTIASGQGFFIQGLSNGQATFNNSMRITGSNMEFFRSALPHASATPGPVVEKHRVWLDLTNEQGAFKQTLVGYVTDATNGTDRNFDGQVLDGGNAISFYSLVEEQPMTIQGRALPFIESDKVRLGYLSSIAGSFTISIEKTDGLLETQNIYLEDKLLNVIHDLKQQPYNFLTEIGTFNDRFELRYTNEALGIDNPELNNSLVIAVKEKKISLFSTDENMRNITIFDLLGRQLQEIKNINSTSHIIQHAAFAEQTLIVKVLLDNGRLVTKKILFR